MYKFRCKLCNRIFFRIYKKHTTAGYEVKFCSIKCSQKARKFKRPPCLNCGKEVPHLYGSFGKRMKFCSIKCSSYGKFNGRWKGGRSISKGKDRTSGYVMVWIPHNERPHKDFRQREHRLVMEKHLGRKLSYNELVHHKNHNKSDNRIENLEVISRSKHQRFHVLLRHGKVSEAYESLKQKIS